MKKKGKTNVWRAVLGLALAWTMYVSQFAGTTAYAYDGGEATLSEIEEAIIDAHRAADTETVDAAAENEVSVNDAFSGMSADEVKAALFNEETDAAGDTGATGTDSAAGDAAADDSWAVSPMEYYVVSSTEYTRVVYNNSVDVTNTNSTEGNEDGGKNFYVAVIESGEDASYTNMVKGTLVEAGKTATLYTCVTTDGERAKLEAGKSYKLLFARFSYMSVGQEGYTWDFGDVFTLDDNNKRDIPEIKDGYSAIKLKANVQKNGSVKFTWKPASELKYKKFALYKVTGLATASKTEEDATKVWPSGNSSTKKTVTIKRTNFTATEAGLYRLDCMDASGAVIEKYYTAVAPYIYYVENDSDKTFELCFTKLSNEDNMNFKLKAAATKATLTAAKGELSQASDLWDIGEYKIKKNVSMDAVRGYYNGSDVTVTMDTKYFFNVQSVYYYNGEKIESSPSNVVSKKSGPEKCYVTTIAGVRYDKNDAADASGLKNADRLTKHVEYYYNDIVSSAQEDLTIPDIYVHENSTGTDAKSGFVFFFGVDNESGIEGYELVRSDSRYGTYKKVKRYKLTSNQLLKVDLTKITALKEYAATLPPLYAMWYNNFPAEKEYYYSVRAVSSGGVTGGFGDGEYNKTVPGKVQNPLAVGIGFDSVTLIWDHDDCAKQYRIYRYDIPSGQTASELQNSIENNIITKESLNWKYVGKVAGSKSKKATYKDDSGNSRIYVYNTYVDKNLPSGEHEYLYYVKPVVDTKKQVTDLDYYSEYDSVIAEAETSATLAQVKSFTASNYGIGRIRLSWKKVKGASSYSIQRLQSNSLTNEMKEDGYAGWTDLDTATGSATSFTDNTVDIGVNYYYRINVSGSSSKSILYTYSGKAKSVPLAVKKATATYRNASGGAKLNWNIDDRDKDYKSSINVKVRYKDDNGNFSDWASAGRGKSNYIDENTLKRGVKRTYEIAASYEGTRGATTTVTYIKPSKVALSDENGGIVDGKVTLNKDSSVKSKWTAYAGNNAVSANTVGVYSQNTNVVQVELSRSGNDAYITLRGVGQGSTTVRVYLDGYDSYTDGASKEDLYKDIRVTVK